MLSTYDLQSVQNFAESLQSRQRDCNGEGMECSNLDEMIHCQFNICRDLNFEVSAWAKKVFSGEVEYDATVEAVFVQQIDRALASAYPVLRRGNELNSVCWHFQFLYQLHQIFQRLSFLKANWISPQKSISPSRRVAIGEDAQREIKQKIAALGDAVSSSNRVQ